MRNAEGSNRLIPLILGTAQDGGVPHVGADSPAWDDAGKRRLAAALGFVDLASETQWLVEATPDIKWQLHRLDQVAREHFVPARKGPDGIIITHAHTGHYLGLAWLGMEMLDARNVPVYVMPQMGQFLTSNYPWRGLIERGNIELHSLEHRQPLQLTDQLTITPLLVPHRDEHSETIGLRIATPAHSLLFIPDIDRWEEWDNWGVRIEEEIAQVDIALLDGTFYDERELPGRAIGEIPHPTITHSMNRFAALPESERKKIQFIHLNHSNPALDPECPEHREILERGFGLAGEEMEIFLSR